jgi:hypothetical protein
MAIQPASTATTGQLMGGLVRNLIIPLVTAGWSMGDHGGQRE